MDNKYFYHFSFMIRKLIIEKNLSFSRNSTIMSVENRAATRVYPKDFIDYTSQVEVDGVRYTGFLGNISETGMCAILPDNFSGQKGDIITGYVHHIPMDDKIEFSGKLVWTEDYEFRHKKYIMVGIQFTEMVDLPDYLFALSLAVES